MAVRKSNGRYVVEFESKGHRVFRRLPPGATKGQAEGLELKLRRELIDQAVLGKTPDITIGALVCAWRDDVASKRKKSAAEQASKVRLTLKALEELGLAELPATAVQEASQELVEHWEGLSPATINRRLCVLKSACKWGWKVKRWTTHNLSPFIALLGGEVVRERTEPEPVIQALIRKMATEEGRAFVALGFYALMRQGEVMALEPKDCKGGAVRIRDWDGKVRTVEVAHELKPHLKALPLTRHRRTLYGEFEQAVESLGLVDFVYHDLRRSGATKLLNEGVPLEVVSHILGHKDLETTRKIYAHVLTETVSKAIRQGFKPIKSPSGKRRSLVSA